MDIFLNSVNESVITTVNKSVNKSVITTVNNPVTKIKSNRPITSYLIAAYMFMGLNVVSYSSIQVVMIVE
jgi:hypothetical protein